MNNPFDSCQYFVRIKYKMLRAFLCIIVLSGTTQAATHYVVPTNTAAANPYTNWATAGTSIIDVVNAAMTNTATRVVWVTNGIYRLTNEVLVTNALTIQSVNGRDVTIVNGNYPTTTNRCFELNDGNAVVGGFTITNGYLIGSNGGGIYLANGMVNNCLISGNIVTNDGSATNAGGGIYMTAGIVSNCMIIGNVVTSSAAPSIHNTGGGICIMAGIMYGGTVSYNRARWGGGIAGYNNVSIIKACTVLSNNATYGGGIFSSGSIISNCNVTGNTASVYGGGVEADYGIMDNCTIVGNWCGTGYGGGVMIRNSALLRNSVIRGNSSAGGFGGGGVVFSSGGIMYNCLIAGNLATNAGNYGGGGGIYFETIKSSHGWVSSCTIVSNISTKGGGGGGIFLYDTNNDNTVSNCVIYGNTAANANYNDVCATNMLANSNTFNYCCFSDPSHAFSGTGNTTNNPNFVDFNGGNYRLTVNSPCVNTGSNQDWMTNGVDLDGRRRIRYGIVDMGAYENIREGNLYYIR